MAPSRRRGANKRKAKDELKLGDLVLAKVKGFPAWPAKISRPEDSHLSPDPRKYFVQFFGTSEIAFVAPADIQVFTHETKSKLLTRCPTKKQFAQAVEDICKAFDEMQQKSSAGPGKDIDSSAVGLVLSPADDLDDSNQQAYQGTPQVEDKGEKHEQMDADKSESSSDEPHGLERCSRSEGRTGSSVQPRTSGGSNLADLSAKKRKEVSENGIIMHNEGKTPVTKSTGGTPSAKVDCSHGPCPDGKDKIGAGTPCESGIKEILPSDSSAYLSQDNYNLKLRTGVVEDFGRDTVENGSTNLENAVKVEEVKGTDNDTTLMVKESTHVSSRVKKNHTLHMKTGNSSRVESEKLIDGAGLTELPEASPRLDNEADSRKGSHTITKSKKHASSSDALQGGQANGETGKQRATEGSSSSRLQGKSSSLSSRKQKAEIDDSRPAKRSKLGDDSFENIPRNSDSSHIVGKGKGDKVVKGKLLTSSLQDEVHMASNSETKQDKKQKVVKEILHPLQKRSGRVLESASIFATKSAGAANSRSPGLAIAGISPQTHVRSRRRAFLIDDDDDEEVHRTPVHRQSTSILISAQSNAEVAESCKESASITKNASTENVQSKTDEMSSINRISPGRTVASSSLHNQLENKETEPGNELGPHRSPSSVVRESQRSPSGAEEVPVISPKTKVAEYISSKPEVKSSPGEDNASTTLPKTKIAEHKPTTSLKTKIAEHKTINPEVKSLVAEDEVPAVSPKTKMSEHKSVKPEVTFSSAEDKVSANSPKTKTAKHKSVKLEVMSPSAEGKAPAISPKTKVIGHKSIKTEVKSSVTSSLKKAQGSSSRPSVIGSSILTHSHYQETTTKNGSSFTSAKLNVNSKSSAVINLVPENRSNVNFSAKPNMEKDAVLGERLDSVKRDKASNVSVSSKFADSDKSLKHLIEAAQAKRKKAHSLSQPHDYASPAVSTPPLINGRSPSPGPNYSAYPLVSENAFPKDAKLFYPSKPFGSPSAFSRQFSANQASHDEYERKTSPAYRQAGGSLSGGTEASIARDALEGMLETLSRTKDSIGRATRLALNCAKYGIANEVVELLIRKLETEPSLHRRIDLFFLVDSITQCSHGQKGIAGASYIPTVQAALPRLLGAAAPPGAGAQENRRQCLKVLGLWLERKILPESLLRHCMDDIVVPNDDMNAGFLLRRPSRAERSVDDPIREMDDMLVDEYGRKNVVRRASAKILQSVTAATEEENMKVCIHSRLEQLKICQSFDTEPNFISCWDINKLNIHVSGW